MTIIAKCPTCAAQVDLEEENPYKPFCSERCKLIDLGEWASEGYSIAGKPRPVSPEDEQDEFSK